MGLTGSQMITSRG